MKLDLDWERKCARLSIECKEAGPYEAVIELCDEVEKLRKAICTILKATVKHPAWVDSDVILEILLNVLGNELVDKLGEEI